MTHTIYNTKAMSTHSEPQVSLFEQVKAILNPILERMNQDDITLTRADIEVMFNTCDHCGVDYDKLIAWYFRDDGEQ
jgi:hypothetical protein